MKVITIDRIKREIANGSMIFLSGYSLGRIVDIYNYFYDARGKEGYFLLTIFCLILGIRSTVSFSFNLAERSRYFSGLLIVFIALFGAQLIYFSSGYNDWSGLLSMLFVITIALLMIFPAIRNKWFLPAFIILISGTIIGFYIEYSLMRWFLVISSFSLLTFYYSDVLRFNQFLLPISGFAFISLFCFWLLPEVREYDSQNIYYDKVVFSKKTRLQNVDVTEWKGHHWFYYDKIKYLSSIDEWMYYEPIVHPLMHLMDTPQNVLIIGGENGCTLRELTKYEGLTIDQLPFDHDILKLATNNPLFLKVNEGVYSKSAVNIVEKEIFNFLWSNPSVYDAIIVDLPDPLDLELNQFYTKEFYELCLLSLKPKGMLSTQAGSPYFATKAFLSIEKTIQSAGMETILMHNQIPSLGEWGWVIGYRPEIREETLISLKNLNFGDIETVWLNKEALNILFSFGKMNVVDEAIQINTLKNPITYELYKEGDLKIN